MQVGNYPDWILITIICVVTAVVSVYWLAPRPKPVHDRIKSPSDTGPSDQVFLFDGSNLIEATDATHSLVDINSAEFNWAHLADVLSTIYPDFPRTPEAVCKQKKTTLSPVEQCAHGNVTCEQVDGIIRVHVSGGGAQQQGTRIAEPTPQAQEVAMRQAPYPVWKTDQDGNVCWYNTAYETLHEKTGNDRSDLNEPLFPLVSDMGPPSKRTRSGVEIRGSDDKLWFDVSVARLNAGLLCFAVDVNAVVDAENAQRNFVQTLAKTFAQLSIGLAIFDRNRQLILFNPALIDLTNLPADFLSARPNLLSFFDRLRDQRMMPEPKNYGSWRHQMADLVAAATDGRYQETWTLPSGAVYSVSGRPHPDGAVAFLIEDITAEITLTRRFRTDLEIQQTVLDQLDDAIAVFSESGGLSLCNEAYRVLWNVDPEASFVQVNVLDATRTWQNHCRATPILGEVREFVGLRENRAEWWGEIQMNSGQTLSCGVYPISHGATMVAFSRVLSNEPGLPDERSGSQLEPVEEV